MGSACASSVAVVAVGAMGTPHERLRAEKVCWARVGTAPAAAAKAADRSGRNLW